jgi:hypothetical protein
LTYYDRTAAKHLDGSPVFKSEADERNESEVAALVQRAWGCELRSLGRLALVDWVAVRDGRVVGIVELKSRSHESAKHPTVFLNFRKWLALTVAALGLGCPAIFVARFTDATLWIAVAEVDAGRCRIGGCLHVVKSRSDVEPVIEVPIAAMRRLA